MLTRSERALGMLIGQALGDALGAPVEGLSAEKIADCVRDVGLLLSDGVPRDLAVFPRLPGLYTDDTQLALALCDTLIQTGTFSPDFFCNVCVRLRQADESLPMGALRGAGPNFLAAVERFAGGIPWNRSGADTAGNGAAMRVAPLGLFFSDDPQRVIRAAAESAICTHANPTGVLAAVTLAQAVAYLSTQSSPKLDVAQAVAHLVERAGHAAEILRVEYQPYLLNLPKDDDPWLAGLALLGELVAADDAVAAERILAHAKTTSAHPIATATAAYAPASVLTALVWALKYHADPVAGLTALIALGGDTDSCGAMFGALCGVLHGPEVWPADWLDELADLERISAVAEALAAAMQDISPDTLLPDLVEAELALTRREAAELAQTLS